MKFPEHAARNPATPAIASALLAAALYAVTLGGTYVYDDVQIVHSDPRVLNHQWKKIWTTDYFDGGIDNLYRPVTSSSYALEWWLHGDRPWIFMRSTSYYTRWRLRVSRNSPGWRCEVLALHKMPPFAAGCFSRLTRCMWKQSPTSSAAQNFFARASFSSHLFY